MGTSTVFFLDWQGILISYNLPVLNWFSYFYPGMWQGCSVLTVSQQSLVGSIKLMWALVKCWLTVFLGWSLTGVVARKLWFCYFISLNIDVWGHIYDGSFFKIGSLSLLSQGLESGICIKYCIKWFVGFSGMRAICFYIENCGSFVRALDCFYAPFSEEKCKCYWKIVFWLQTQVVKKQYRS